MLDQSLQICDAAVLKRDLEKNKKQEFITELK